MVIKSKATVSEKYLAACKRAEAEKALEMRESKRLHDLRRAVGSKKREGRVGAKSRWAVMNAVRTEGKEVLTEAGEGFWKDMERRYKWQAPDGEWEDGYSPNGRKCRLGVVKERWMHGVWHVWDKVRGCWVAKGDL